MTRNPSEVSTKSFAETKKLNTSQLVEELLKKLGPGLSPAQFEKSKAFSLGIFTRMTQSSDGGSDESLVVQRIQKELSSKGKSRDAVLFHEQVLKLKSFNVMSTNQVCSCLSFLAEMGLAEQAGSLPKFTSFVTDSGNNDNGNRTFQQRNQELQLRDRDPFSSQNVYRGPEITSRVSYNAVVPRNPQPLQVINKESDENEIIRDLLYTLQGIPGSNIVYNSYEDRFSLSRQNNQISESTATHVNKLCGIGWLYTKIRKFIESRSNDKAYGLIGQGLCVWLQKELTEFDRLIAVLEAQVQLESDQGIYVGESTFGLTLSQLDVWTFEARHRLKMLAALLDNCRNKKGGSLLTVVHNFGLHGDPEIKSLVKDMKATMLHPLQNMIVSWLCFGELNDFYNEFFISSNPSVKPERLWNDKYFLNKAMLPVFLSEYLASKILLVGKSLNFIRDVCKDNTSLDFLASAEVAEGSKRNQYLAMLKGDFEGGLKEIVQISQEKVNKFLLELLMKKYQLVDHLQAFRKYLLFGQGDFIRQLMDVLGGELDRPATELYKHNLAGCLETAIRATNAQYDNPDVLQRLDVRLLEWSPGDVGWDVFSLHYHVTSSIVGGSGGGAGPLPTIFTNQSVLLYLRIFNFLWRAKRIEFVLSTMWIQQNSYCRLLSSCEGGGALRGVLHKVRQLHGSMCNLVQQMQYYLMFEVLECSWANLLASIQSAPNLDHVIAAHQTFLEAIISGSLLEESLTTLLTQVRAIFDIIVQYQHMQARFFNSALHHLAISLPDEESADAKGSSRDPSDVNLKQFYKEVVPKFRAELKIISTSFRDLVINLLLSLHSQQNDILQSLAYRLDFNDFYRSQDPRLRHTHRAPPSTAATAAATALIESRRP